MFHRAAYGSSMTEFAVSKFSALIPDSALMCSDPQPNPTLAHATPLSSGYSVA